jgi:peptide/nickel transport system ATP-binding protein
MNAVPGMNDASTLNGASRGPLLSVADLTVRFAGERSVNAVNGVTFELAPGEVLGLLGESGSGKSVTLRALLRLHDPRKSRQGGRIVVEGSDVMALEGRALERYRGGIASMVFQEPGLAFDPVYTIGAQIAETVRAHEGAGARAAKARALEMLDLVQIPQARRRYDAYPFEMSGGMRQRAMIALALACRPRLLLADEPTTALDATVQIQILVLLRELQRSLGMSVIFVTHDIGAAVEVSDRLAVMYAGRIVEEGAVEEIVESARHPYTAALLAATVSSASRGRELPAIPGAPPDLARLPAGCAFAPRCARATSECVTAVPPLVGFGHRSACIHPLSTSEQP